MWAFFRIHWTEWVLKSRGLLHLLFPGHPTGPACSGREWPGFSLEQSHLHRSRAPSALFPAALLLATSSIECRFCAACAPLMGHVALCLCEPGAWLCWSEQLGRAPSQNLEDGLLGSRLWVAPSHRSLALSCLTGSREKVQPPAPGPVCPLDPAAQSVLFFTALSCPHT